MANLLQAIIKLFPKHSCFMNIKKCTKCGGVKPLTEFHYSKIREQWVAACKICVNKKSMLRYQENPVYRNRQIKMSKKRYDDKKKKFLGLDSLL